MIEDLKPLFKWSMWFFSIVFLFAFWTTISKIGISGYLERMSKHPPQDLVGAMATVSISMWWVTRNFFKGKSKTVVIQSSTATIFLVKNILAPLLVSYIIYSITGSPSLTFISVPIIGLVSANIGIG